MAEWNGCLTTEQYNEISEIYERLKAEDNDTLNETLPEYIENADRFETIVQNDEC